LEEAYHSELNPEELRLLTAIARAPQDGHPGWELTESMTKVVELYNASVNKLEELGYIKSHTIGGKYRYYTATKAGRAA
jgi:DNA-binding MarR family transcriptional regulator